MTFLLPLGLLALLSLPIILLLHLIRERRRRVAVPSLLHWRDVPQPPSGERRQRLPLTLLLLLHLVIAGLIGLALGRPQVPGPPLGHVPQIALVIDTSTSMATREGGTTRLALARDRARALLHGMSSADRVTLVAAGPRARVVTAGGAGEVAALEAALNALEPGGTGADLAGALTLAEAALDPQRPARIVVLTDGATPPVAGRTVAAAVDWQIVGSNQPNRAIIAFAARAASNAVQVYARAANHGRTPFATTLRLYRDDQRIDSRNITFTAQGETELTWQLPAGGGTLRAELDGKDALPQDDQAALNIAPTRPVNVLLVSSKPEALQRALAVIPDVNVATVDPLTYAGAPAGQPAADLTILDSFLPAAWPAGASLAINPPPGSQLLDIADLSIPLKGQNLSQAGATLAGLGFGGVRFDAVRQIVPPAWAETQLAADEMPLIMRGREGNHEIAIWAFDLKASNLPTRLAFPLLVARTVRDLVPAPLPPALQAGAPLTLRASPRTTEVQVIAPDGQVTQMRASPVLTFDTLLQPGWYRVVERGPAGPLFEGRVAVNAGAAQESDLQPQPAPALNGRAVEADQPAQHHPVDVWPWLAIAVLAVLLLEWGYSLR